MNEHTSGKWVFGMCQFSAHQRCVADEKQGKHEFWAWQAQWVCYRLFYSVQGLQVFALKCQKGVACTRCYAYRAFCLLEVLKGHYGCLLSSSWTFLFLASSFLEQSAAALLTPACTGCGLRAGRFKCVCGCGWWIGGRGGDGRGQGAFTVGGYIALLLIFREARVSSIAKWHKRKNVFQQKS